MARSNRTPKRHPFYAALAALGCTYCATCHAYMLAEHVEHMRSLANDAHSSRYAVVGGYGHVRAVDLTADAAEVA